jgi:hypothetical protein
MRIDRQAAGFIFGMGAAPALIKRKAELQKLSQKLGWALYVNFLRRQIQAP